MKTKKIKKTTATVILFLLACSLGYLIINGLFVKPIKDVFADKDVTFSGVLAIIIAYLIIAIIVMTVTFLWRWSVKQLRK